MGTPDKDRARPLPGRAPIHMFYSTSTWIEGKALDQLEHVASLAGVRNVAAFPDLHPGRYGPVGCAILADRLYPYLIGNDIGCGMSLFELDIPVRKIRLDKAAQRLRALEMPWTGDADIWLENAGLARADSGTGLGSIGGGNHFCELQEIDVRRSVVGLEATSNDKAFLLVHSGSRNFGSEIFAEFMDSDPASDTGLVEGSTAFRTYLDRHDQAVAWASLNRAIIAHRAARILQADCRLVADAPHNLIERYEGAYLHRKGAAKADGPLVPLAGSRDSLSYVMRPSGKGSGALVSLSHGAGRKYDRRSMSKRVGSSRSDRERLTRTSFGGFVVCEDRQLLLEEAPVAYKNCSQVLDDLVQAGLVECVASLKPLITFKKAAQHDDEVEKTREHTKRRGRKGR